MIVIVLVCRCNLKVSCTFTKHCRFKNTEAMIFDFVDADGNEIRATAWKDEIQIFKSKFEVCQSHSLDILVL